MAGLPIEDQLALVGCLETLFRFTDRMMQTAQAQDPTLDVAPWEDVRAIVNTQATRARRQLAPNASPEDWCQIPREVFKLLVDNLDRCCAWLLEDLRELRGDDVRDVDERIAEIQAHYTQIAELRVRWFGADVWPRVM